MKGRMQGNNDFTLGILIHCKRLQFNRIRNFQWWIIEVQKIPRQSTGKRIRNSRLINTKTLRQSSLIDSCLTGQKMDVIWKFYESNSSTSLFLHWVKTRLLGPGRTRQIFVYFAKKFVVISVIQVRPVIFFSHQILSSITKLQRRRRPASEQDIFLPGVKTVQI